MFPIAENSNISSSLLYHDEGQRKKSQDDGIKSYHILLWHQAQSTLQSYCAQGQQADK